MNQEAPLLEVRDLAVQFRTEAGIARAVDGVSFAVGKGRTLGVVGESGCGKSVTALSLLRLVPDPPGHIARGQIVWKGRDLLGLPAREMPKIRGREIAMIFQDPSASLNPVFTVGRMMGEVIKTRFGLKGRPAMEKAAAALASVGIAEPESRLLNYPHELSGGMKQRVLIAMALLCEPELLVADEPTTALDVTIQKQILFLIAELRQRLGMSVILITHDIGVIAETCDDVLVMYAGRIVESCDVYTLFHGNRHPYTRGLMASLPKRGRDKNDPLPTIEGSVPSIIDPPPGCRFANRCPAKGPRCETEDPALTELGPGHFAACHYPLEPQA